MTCEDIIQRLLDEKHITVKEAMIMIKELVKNSLPNISIPEKTKEKDFWNPNEVVVMYGISTSTVTKDKSNDNNGISIDSTDYFTKVTD